MNKDQLYLSRLTELGAEICRQNGWKVIQIDKITSEFSPTTLGVNICKGNKILIRLKYENAIDYIHWSELIGTLCHELAHNSIWGHPPAFYRLMDKLHDDIEKLPRYEEIYAEMTGTYYSRGYTVVNNLQYNKNNNNNKATSNKVKYNKYVTPTGRTLQPTKSVTIKKPISKEGKRLMMLECLEKRGIV